jgi:hypothetical protein
MNSQLTRVVPLPEYPPVRQLGDIACPEVDLSRAGRHYNPKVKQGLNGLVS